MSELIEAFREAVQNKKYSIIEFFQQIKHNTVSPSVEAFCLWVIEHQLIVANYLAVVLAATELARRRNLKILEQVLILKQKLSEKDSEYQRYRGDLEYIIAILTNAKTSKCNCAVYQDSTFNTPPYQEDLEELERRTNPAENGDNSYTIRVKCKGCGKIWDVEIDETYHYPHSHWRLVEQPH